MQPIRGYGRSGRAPLVRHVRECERHPGRQRGTRSFGGARHLGLAPVPPKTCQSLLAESRPPLPSHVPSFEARLGSRTSQEGQRGREITENIGFFSCFPIFWSVAGGRPALRLHISFPPAFHVRKAGSRGFDADIPPARQPPFWSCLSFPLPHFSAFGRAPRIGKREENGCPACGGWRGGTTRDAKDFPTIGNIFSNHWKIAERFFQSLEKQGGIFQPLENFFPIIGKTAFGRGSTGLCAPRGRAPAACRKFRGGKRAGRVRRAVRSWRRG